MPARGIRPPASEAERESIANLIQSVFQSDETTDAHRAMVAMQGFDPASLPTVWDNAGRPLATVQAVPCEVALLNTWLPAGIITMVATAEHARGQGHMRACMDAAHQWMLDNGRPVGILYGVPEIYPKFGYRPLMPRCETRYEFPAGSHGVAPRPATEADSAILAELFNDQEQSRPCAVKRGNASWIWESPCGFASIWCIEAAGQVSGYIRVLRSEQNDPALTVIEAACRLGQQGILLAGTHALAKETGKARIALRLMPDHPLVSEVVRKVTSLQMHGVEQSVIPPQAGMLAILDGGAVLKQLRPQIEARLAGRSLRITGAGMDTAFSDTGNHELRLADPADLAHLLTGYPGAIELRRWGRLQADNASLALAAQVFPTSWPRWILAPFWDE